MVTTAYDLFLSHNRQQKPWVRELARFLRNIGLVVFFDEDSIKPGDDFPLAIENAIEASRIVILILSRAALKSRWVSFETALRVFEDPLAEKKSLIPIITETVDPSDMRFSLRRLDAVDLTNPSTREREFLHFLRALGVPDEKCEPIDCWPVPTGMEEIFVADVNSVVAAGWSGIQLLDRLIALDYEVFEGLIPTHEGSSSQWAPVFMQHPDTWRLLTTEAREIVGYWHFVPLFNEDYDRAVQGTLLDSEITADKLRLFELPGSYDIYFVSFAMQDRFRRPKAVAQLFHSLLGVIESLAKDGVLIRRVCANAYTDSGVSLCRSLGMEETGSHSEHGRIFTGKMVTMLADLPMARDSSIIAAYYPRPEHAGQQG